jgi:hypothetical protein
MDERELEQLFDKFRNGVDLTDQEMRKLGRGTSEFGKTLKSVGLDLTKTMGGFAKGLAEGATDFKQLNPVIDGVVGGLGEMAKAIPYAGNLAAGALKLVAEGSKFMIGQLQEATTAFQEISKIGGLTAQGMSGLREQFLRSGQTLQGFQKTVSANAQALARFSGTVGSGAEDFSKIVGGIIDSDLGDQLRRIGFTADEIGETTAGYIAQQTRLGLAQNKTQAQLIAGSKQYADELDVLARLTGQSREALQKQQDAALSEGRFRATLDTLDEKTAKSLLDFQSRLAGAGFGEMAQGVRDITSGFTQSEAAIKLFQSTGGEAANIIERLKNNQIDQDEAARLLQRSIKDNIATNREFTRAVGDGVAPFIKYSEASDFASATIENGAIKAKKAQAEAQAGTDGLTNDTVSAQKALEQMGRNLNNMAFQALPHAATAVNAFAGVLNKATAEISKQLGIKPPAAGGAAAPGGAPSGAAKGGAGGGAAAPGGAPSGAAKGGAGGGGGGGKPHTSSLGGRVASAGAGAATGAVLGSVIPGIGTAFGGLIGGIAGYFGYEMAAGGPNPDDVLDFTGQSGGRANFDQLDSDLKRRVLAAGQQYLEATGKKLQVNSAKRDTEDQKRLYDETVKAGRPGVGPTGMAVAKPGTSAHEHGRAIDIQNYRDGQALAAMNSQGLFQTVPKDPVHFQIKAANGGVFAGPRSGYAAMLHGTEAVVPLPDGKTIPVQMPELASSMGEQLGVMGAQLAALESIVAAMRDQNSISAKILQATNN